MRSYGAVRELDPTSAQRALMTQAVGSARFAQNWAVSFVKSQLDKHEHASWSAISLHTAWRQHRDEVAPWYDESSKENFQYGCKRAANALANWKASKKGTRRGRKMDFPSLRKRGYNDSTAYTAAKLRACGTKVHIPRIGEISLKEVFILPGQARIPTIIIRSRAGRWFVTFQVREDDWQEPAKKEITDFNHSGFNKSVVGVDAGMGLRFATLSDGNYVENPRFFKSGRRRIKHVSKAIRRKKKGSSRRRKALARLSVVYYRINSQRQDFTHKFTTGLVKSHDEIVIEDLNLHAMKSALKLGRSVSDVAWGEVRRQLEYKCSWYGTTLTVVSRWFPSSKQCHVCSLINGKLLLHTRVWTCSGCHTIHDRDLNAALNLQAASSVVSARGDDVRLDVNRAIVSEASISREERRAVAGCA